MSQSQTKEIDFSISSSHSLSPFALIHVDIWGSCSTTSIHGHKYFLTIVDDHTRFVWVLPMSSKAETQSLLQGFVKFVERKFDTNVKAICSDNVAKFIMSHFFQAIGIIHQTCIKAKGEKE